MEWFAFCEAVVVASAACGLMYVISHDFVLAKQPPSNEQLEENNVDLVLPPPSNQNNLAENSCHKILPNLYLGGELAAADIHLLQSKKITHILNVAQEVENYFPTAFTYCRLDLVDFDLDAGVSRSFQKAFEFSHQCQQQCDDGILFVHSMSGVNRAATVCVAILIHTHEYTLQQAISLISSTHSKNTCILQDNFLELAMLELATNSILNRPTMLWSETQQI